MDKMRLVKKLIRKYGTNNPFELCEYLDFIVVKAPLSGIRGCCQRKQKNTIIYIDSRLPEYVQLFVCAHELYHALCHKDLNRLYMDTYTLMVSSKYEIASNQFAVCLLYPDDSELYELLEMPIERAAAIMGVEISEAEYRLNLVVKQLEKV